MPSPPERSAGRIAVHGFVTVLLILGAIPAYLGLPPSWRPVAIRSACALLVVAGCVRVVRAVRGSIGPASAVPARRAAGRAAAAGAGRPLPPAA